MNALRKSLCMAWLVVAMAPALTLAATPLRLKLTPDGSAIPPGDLLEVEVLFFPGETELMLEVRAFRVLEMPAYKAIPIASRSKTVRDERGNYLLRAKIVKPKEARLAKSSLAIPYSHLDLTRGMHGLAYEITGLIDRKIDFVRATQVDYVIVSDKTRTEMQLEKEKMQVSADREKQQINIVKDGKLTTADTEIEVKRSNYDHSTERVKVSIPGEFRRPMLAPAMHGTQDEKDDSIWAALPKSGTAWDSLDKFEPKSKRTILFATNRIVENPKLLTSARFGNDAANVAYGTALVNIPVETHRRGQLEVPGWWNARDPRKHFLVESLNELSLAEFQKAASGDCLLFVHGFNTSFDFSVLRTAQLVHDLQFPGQGIAFSWPSAGSTSSYFHDEKEAEKSSVALMEVFERLIAAAPEESPRKIHVIAHSMGNRVFMNAVRQYELKHPNSQPFIGHVALAAPDVNGASFAALLPSVQRLSGYVTLYYCSSDRALEASRTIHQDKPVGLGPWFADGVETVNADNANTEMLGHGYYASSHPLLIDLRLLLVFDEPADNRLPPLTSKTMVLGYPHWAFSPAR